LHPLTPADTQKTSELVEQYLAGNYPFGRGDLNYLFSKDDMEGTTENHDVATDGKEDRPKGAVLFQESLPEYLRGKRPKDMSVEEKRKYKNIRSKVSRANQTKEKEKEIKEVTAKRNASKRAMETSAERKDRNKAKAKANANKRARESSPERKERNKAKAKATADKRSRETSEESKQRQSKDRQQRAFLLANMMQEMLKRC
jgi:translation initiation factor IF-2